MKGMRLISMIPINIDWDAVSAIGQWVGAIGTIWAVKVALEQSKPKFRVIGGTRIIDDKERFAVSITNIGNIPAIISMVGLEAPRRLFLINSNGQLPKKIEPGECIEFIDFQYDFIYQNILKYDSVVVFDGLGNKHYKKTTLKKRLMRWFTLKKNKF